MKIALPLGLLIALVFGVTYITQFSTAPRPADDPAAAAAPVGPPIEFPTQQIAYDPNPPERNAVDLANMHFSGFFELGTERNLVPYYFTANRPDPVRIAALPPSCGKCTSARGAVIPPEAVNAYAAKAAAGRLWGPGLTPDLLSAIGWAELYGGLSWHQFDFGRPDQMMTVPGASADGRRPWGVIELAFKIGVVGAPAPTSGYFEVYAADGTKLTPQPLQLTAVFAGREPFEVYPTDVDVGDLGPGTPPRTAELVVFSTTRDADRLPPPTVAPSAADPFVTVGPPAPLTPDQCRALEARLAGDQKAMRVRSGYRYAVTVRREADGRTHDIGKLERDLFVAGPASTRTYKVLVHGTVSGLVRLEGGKGAIDLGAYDAKYAKKATARVRSDEPGLELELVPGECRPAFVRYTLGEPETESGRRTWPVQLHIEPNAGRSPPWDGQLVLRTKGPNPTTVRIPVTGHGR